MLESVHAAGGTFRAFVCACWLLPIAHPPWCCRYDFVLRSHSVSPIDDTFYYRVLLKLSLRGGWDWLDRVEAEVRRNTDKFRAGLQRRRTLARAHFRSWRLFVLHATSKGPARSGAGRAALLYASAYGRQDSSATAPPPPDAPLDLEDMVPVPLCVSHPVPAQRARSIEWLWLLLFRCC